MAKGSVRKKGKKWYYRYYVEDASGNLDQKECVGTESKSETEKLLRKAMEEYESKKIVAKTENITLGELLDVWVDEELKVSSLSNNTVTLYLGVVKIIKRLPLSKRKLRTVTSEHMQEFMDYLSFGGKAPDGTEAKPLSIDRIHSFSAVLQRAFRYAVFPKQYISFNPMQYVVIRRPAQEVDLFATEDEDFSQEKTITHQQYNEIVDYLTKKKSSSSLAVQIAYYAGLRIGEVTGLSWDDINLEEQYLTVRRSLSRNNARHKLELGPTKRKKVRIVDFGDTLAEILRKAKKEQHKQRFQYGQLYQRNYYKEVREKNRVYYELYSLDGTQEVPEDYTEISLVCVRQDGMYLGREALDWMCRSIRKHLKGFENFHFHSLRHTYTLVKCGYIHESKDYYTKGHPLRIQLIDPFLLFHYHFLSADSPVKIKKFDDYKGESGKYHNWRGHAFEIMCMYHFAQIKKALGISGVNTNEYSWISEKKKNGVQIDLVIERADGITNICEEKYTDTPFAVSEEYEAKLLNKVALFREETKTKNALKIVMICTDGISGQAHIEHISRVIELDDLFE